MQSTKQKAKLSAHLAVYLASVIDSPLVLVKPQALILLTGG